MRVSLLNLHVNVPWKGVRSIIYAKLTRFEVELCFMTHRQAPPRCDSRAWRHLMARECRDVRLWDYFRPYFGATGEDVWAQAIANGNIVAVLWAAERGEYNVWESCNLAMMACHKGNVELLERFDPSAIDLVAFAMNASKNGDLNVLRWIAAMCTKGRLALDNYLIRLVRSDAIVFQHVHVMLWLRDEQGYTPRMHDVLDAGFRTQKPMAVALLQNGWPVPVGEYPPLGHPRDANAWMK